MLVDRVIAQLDAGEYSQGFPNLAPIGFDGFGMLFSTSFNNGSEERWSVSYSTHGWAGALFMMNSVQLQGPEFIIDLTRDQKKRLTKAFLRAINEAHADWKRRKKEAAL